MLLDIERYRPYVDHFDMAEADKIELIHIISAMMQSFVDRAFGESPEQTLLGKDDLSSTGSGEVAVESTEISRIFNDVADGDAQEERYHDR